MNPKTSNEQGIEDAAAHDSEKESKSKAITSSRATGANIVASGGTNIGANANTSYV